MLIPKKEKIISKKEAFIKVCSFCAYQERTQNEVREKLYSFKLSDEDIEEILSQLILENFVNEERFAKAFAGGKYRIKNWGKRKIEEALKQKGLSTYCINKGLAELSDKDGYIKTLSDLLVKKSALEKEQNIFKKRNKLAKHAISKGYESELVWETINLLIR